MLSGAYYYDPPAPQFTSKERDIETALDNFGKRYFGSTMGRFMSPDPLGGHSSDPQTLNKYAYARNNPIVFIDPTGKIVEWHDSKEKCKKAETVCRTNAQREYEDRLKQMRESKDKNTREKGERLTRSYERLQQSKAVFEVKNQGGSEASKGEFRYDGNDHFTINLAGNTAYALSDNQRLAHEFEHGRQVLDGELSFQFRNGAWLPYAYDLMDEVRGFQSGFDIESVTPGQGTIINGIARALATGGLSNAAQYLNDHTNYRGLPLELNVPNPPPPNVYVVPK